MSCFSQHLDAEPAAEPVVAAEVDVAVVPGTVAAVVPGTVAAVPEAVVAKGAVGVPWRVAVLVSEAARNSTQFLRPPRGRLSRALVEYETCLLLGGVELTRARLWKHARTILVGRNKRMRLDAKRRGAKNR